MRYGSEPVQLALVELAPSEMCLTQYMPIIMPDCGPVPRIPYGLQWVLPLMEFIQFSAKDYVYLTAKHMWVTPENMGNRAGWHTDGFGTNDINYAWCDRDPTEFCIQDFNLTDDCDLSLSEMEEQARPECIVTYPENMLLRLDQFNVHRVPVHAHAGWRTFVRFSVSPDRYDLHGNAHNPLFDYNWEMQPRKALRNHTSANKY